MLKRGVYDRDWIPQCGGGNVYTSHMQTNLRAGGIPHRNQSDIYHDKLMFLLEDLARAERTDADPRHRQEYMRARKRAVDLYVAGKDPDPRLDTHNMQFPMLHTIGDEMYGCASCEIDLPPEKLAAAIAAGVFTDPYVSPTGTAVSDNPYTPSMYSNGYDVGMGT